MTGVILLVLRILLALTLYTFLGVSLITIWRDLKFQKDLAVGKQQVPSIGIEIHEDGDSQTYLYRGSEVNIGRHPTSDCVLESESVSANHARLYYDQKQWWIEDLDSTNGSFIETERIISPTVVVDADVLLCGDVKLKIELPPESRERVDVDRNPFE